MTSFNKKMLEITIEKIKGPKNPKPQLEQHMTPSNIASETIWFALQHGLIINKKILDIGSGTGRLCLGSLIAGANECVSIEIDDEEIEEQIKYAKKLGIECKVEIIKADGASVPLRDSSLDVT
ncbi:MAG: METTL5 family protein, partial [Fervidicoccus fontis]